jgi:CDP-4-dehydro-6-deoxyglucose reductase
VATSDILIDANDLSALHGIESKFFPSRISSIDLLSEDITLVKLRLPPALNMVFLPGQFIDVIGPNSVKRSYSIASNPSSREISLLIKRIENGEFSDYWFNKAKPNDFLRIEGPKGTFFLRDRHKKLVFLATGTGIAPIQSILETLDSDPDFNQSESISLFWGNRAKDDFIWTPNFKKLEVEVNLIVSRDNSNWNGEVGYVHDFALSKINNIDQTGIYACGASQMINSAKAKFFEAGLKESNFYSDPFVQSF